MQIREYDHERDLSGLRAAMVQLQDFERAIDPRLPPGDAIADPYIDDLFTKCAKHDGQIYVAEVAGEIAGYVTILARVESRPRSQR